MAPTIGTIENQLTKVVAVGGNDADGNDANGMRRRATVIKTTIIVSPELTHNRHHAISLLHNHYHYHHHLTHTDNDVTTDVHQSIYNDFSSSLQHYRSQLVPVQQSAFDDTWSRLYTDANNNINYELVPELLLKEIETVSAVCLLLLVPSL